MPSRVIRTATAEIWLDDDGILHAVNLPDSHETVETAQENVAAGFDMTKGEPYRILVDIRKTSSIEREARHFYGTDNALKAMALLVDSPLSTMFGNFFLGINKPPCPTRLFRQEKAAIKWLIKTSGEGDG